MKKLLLWQVRILSVPYAKNNPEGFLLTSISTPHSYYLTGEASDSEVIEMNRKWTSLSLLSISMRLAQGNRSARRRSAKPKAMSMTSCSGGRAERRRSSRDGRLMSDFCTFPTSRHLYKNLVKGCCCFLNALQQRSYAAPACHPEGKLQIHRWASL